MQKINFQNLPNTSTPVNATNLNAIQTNVENVFNGTVPMGNIKVDTVTTKNLFNINGEVNVKGSNGNIENKNSVSGNILTTNTNSSVDNFCGQKIDNINGKTITFSAKVLSIGTGTRANLGIYDNNTLIVDKSERTVGNYITITYTATSNNIIVAFACGGGIGAQFTDIQVEIGDTRTDYAKYQNLDINIKQGEWTPVIEYANVTYDRQEGTYYKIGKLVNLTFRLQGTINSVTSPGYAFISGVPFDAKQQAGSLNECANCFTNDNSTPRLLRIVNRQLGIQDGSSGGANISIWEAGHGTFFLSGTITYTSEN